MDPFTLWLLGGVVAPDTYERALDRLGERSVEDRLAETIRADVGRYPKRVFRRWYRKSRTWEALVKGGSESFQDLVDRLIEVSGERLLGAELSHDRAETIVRAAVVGFTGSLDPSDAVDVADYRSAQRDRLIDDNAEQRTSDLRVHVNERFDAVETRLEAAADFERRVASLPTAVRPFFQAVGATRESLRLLDIGSAERPQEALVQLTADIPPWLRDAPADTLRAAAELCRAYRVHLGAGAVFELAANVSSDRAYVLARAAIEFQTVGEADRANELIRRATALNTSGPIGAMAAALADDPGTVREVLTPDAALRDPFLVSVYLYGLRTPQAFAEVIPFLTVALSGTRSHPG